MERVRLAIWDHRPSEQKPHPTASEIIRTTRLGSSTVYKCLKFMEKRGEIKRVRVKGVFHIILQGSALAGKESEQRIYEALHSKNSKVVSLALKELDQLSQVSRIRNDDLLKLITDKNWLKSGMNFRILTRQAALAKEQNDPEKSHKLGLRRGYAGQIAQSTSEDRDFRDEAFLYLKVVDLDAAVKVALRMVEAEAPDEALDSKEPTQFWINVSTTLATAARTQASTRRQLYSLIEGKTGTAADRARKIIEIAVTQEQDTKPGMFGDVPPKPPTKAGVKLSVK